MSNQNKWIAADPSNRSHPNPIASKCDRRQSWLERINLKRLLGQTNKDGEKQTNKTWMLAVVTLPFWCQWCCQAWANSDLSCSAVNIISHLGQNAKKNVIQFRYIRVYDFPRMTTADNIKILSVLFHSGNWSWKYKVNCSPTKRFPWSLFRMCHILIADLSYKSLIIRQHKL